MVDPALPPHSRFSAFVPIKICRFVQKAIFNVKGSGGGSIAAELSKRGICSAQKILVAVDSDSFWENAGPKKITRAIPTNEFLFWNRPCPKVAIVLTIPSSQKWVFVNCSAPCALSSHKRAYYTSECLSFCERVGWICIFGKDGNLTFEESGGIINSSNIKGRISCQEQTQTALQAF